MANIVALTLRGPMLPAAMEALTSAWNSALYLMVTGKLLSLVSLHRVSYSLR